MWSSLPKATHGKNVISLLNRLNLNYFSMIIWNLKHPLLVVLQNVYILAWQNNTWHAAISLGICKWTEADQNLQKCAASKEADELPLDKTNKWPVGPVWSESSLSAGRPIKSLATHWAHSEDRSDWVDALTGLSLCWAHMPYCWFCRDAAQIVFTFPKFCSARLNFISMDT